VRLEHDTPTAQEQVDRKRGARRKGARTSGRSCPVADSRPSRAVKLHLGALETPSRDRRPRTHPSAERRRRTFPPAMGATRASARTRGRGEARRSWASPSARRRLHEIGVVGLRTPALAPAPAGSNTGNVSTFSRSFCRVAASVSTMVASFRCSATGRLVPDAIRGRPAASGYEGWVTSPRVADCRCRQSIRGGEDK
jgi:hypothetical protein